MGWWSEDADDKDRRIEELERKLSVVEMERDFLAVACENMRQWMLADTALAARLAASVGPRKE